MTTTGQIRNEQGERIDTAFHGGDRQGVMVVLGHGVTGNKDRPLLVAIANGLSAKGWPCVRFSFSGNGESEGSFADATITKETGDLMAVLRAVPQERRIAYIGHSMGAAVGVINASRGLAIQALVSLAGMVHTGEFLEREFGDVSPGEGNMWDEEGCPLSKAFSEDMKQIGSLVETAAKVRQPWLLIHGTADDVVPLQDSIDAHDAARCEKKLIRIPDAGHSFDEESYPVVVEAIDAWLTQCFG
ncbi:alpha/beta fold hydrolase [Akkermansiaceae bacterium]|nr:alpha/beta fold hydrolase [Akkermansiaceae bacterium]